MKVTITATDNPYQIMIGGKHIHQLLLEKGLSELGVDVVTFYPVVKYDPPINRYIKYLISLLRNRDLTSPYKDRIWQIVSQLETLYSNNQNVINKTDIIHFHDVVSLYSFVKSKIKNNAPQILTVHGYFAREFIDYNRIPKFVKDRVYLLALDIEKEAIVNADFIIAVDSQIKNYILEFFGYSKSEIVVLPNAIDTETFSPVSKSEQAFLKKKLGFTPEDFLILVPRRLVPKNGVIYAVRAMKFIEEENIKLVILGDGIERKNIEKEIKKYNLNKKVLLFGSVPHSEIHRYFKATDVVLIPSITSHGVQEATSLAALEGMSCGKPVIATNVGGLKEIIKDGKTGFLIPEKDPHAIANLIDFVFNNPHIIETLGINARRHVLERHSYIQYAKQVLSIYHNIMLR